MNGLCECGCGQQTVVSPITDRWHGWTKGEPRRFVAGHNNRVRRVVHVEEDRGHITPCWVWPGSKNERGYGRLASQMAHRVYYERHVGPVPEGMELDHLCRQRDCVNPAHLEPVTHKQNMQRGYAVTQAPGAEGFPAALRAARRAAGLSQPDLGAVIGVSGALVGLWERGRHRILDTHAEALICVLPDLAEDPLGAMA